MSPHKSSAERSLLRHPPAELALRLSGAGRDGQVIRLSASKCAIGGADYCTLQLRSPGLEPVHCLILRGQRETLVRRWAVDTRLNGQAFDDAPLRVGDMLSVGPLDLEVLAPEPTPPSPAAADQPEHSRKETRPANVASRSRHRRRRRQLVQAIRAAQQRVAVLAVERDRQAALVAQLEHQREMLEQRSAALEAVGLDHAAAAQAARDERERLNRQIDEQQQQLQQQRAELEETRQALAAAEEAGQRAAWEGKAPARENDQTADDQQQHQQQPQQEQEPKPAAAAHTSGLSCAALLPELFDEEPSAVTRSQDVLPAPLLEPEPEDGDIFGRLRELALLREQQTAEAEVESSVTEQEEPREAEVPPSAVEAVSDSEGRLPETSHDDDDSIEDYMAGLLRRVRGDSYEADEPASHTPLKAAAPVVKQIQSPVEPEPADDWDPSKMSPRRTAPEQNSDIARMRALANSTAKSAIDASRHRRMRAEAIGKGVVSLTATATGAVLIYMSPDVLSIGFLGGVSALVVATNWAIRGAMLQKQVRVDRERFESAERRIRKVEEENARLAEEKAQQQKAATSSENHQI